MTEEELRQEEPMIHLSQSMHTRLNVEIIAKKGAQPIDVLIGAMYASAGLAASITGGPPAAIEWMRTALDHMERRVLDDIANGDRGADGRPAPGKAH